MWVSHFPCWSAFSQYSRSYSVCFSFSTFFSVSSHILGHIVWVSHFFPVLSLYCRSYIVHLSFFYVYECFSTYSRSYSVCVSFSMFFSFLAIIQVLQCVFLTFHIFQCFSPYSSSYFVSFSFFSLSSFIAIFLFLQC